MQIIRDNSASTRSNQVKLVDSVLPAIYRRVDGAHFVAFQTQYNPDPSKPNSNYDYWVDFTPDDVGLLISELAGERDRAKVAAVAKKYAREIAVLNLLAQGVAPGDNVKI